MPEFRELRDGLLERETTLLQEAGYRVVSTGIVEGLATLEVLAPDTKTGMGELTLTITLPDSYPLLPPRVRATGVRMTHHQHPFAHDLCLIERSTQNWIPEWRLAGLLDNQLRRALAAGHTQAGNGHEEVDQGEPFSAYYSYLGASGLLIDSSTTTFVPGGRGDLEASLILAPCPIPGQPRLFGIIERLTTPQEVLYTAPGDLRTTFGPYQPNRAPGRWVVLDAPPKTAEAKEIWQVAAAADPHPPKAFQLGEGQRWELRAIGFPEEHARTHTGTGWIFVLKRIGQVVRGKSKGGKGRPAGRSADEYVLIKAYRAGRADMTYRAPETQGLEHAKVVVLGCGAIGSVLVEQLARAGIGALTLIDSDTLEPGNLSRHAAAFDTVGIDKSHAMAHRVRHINPYAAVTAHTVAIGAAQLVDGTTPETDFLTEMFTGADLVIDATAEIGVQQYTALLARETRTTWVAADATPGIGGGSVVKIDADAHVCFGCFLWHQHRGSLPVPVAVDSALVQPTGCASPTFTGTGFDLAVISLQAARVAVGALQRGTTPGYPQDGHDAHILTLRDRDGNLCPPRWDGFTLTRHAECPDH